MLLAKRVAEPESETLIVPFWPPTEMMTGRLAPFSWLTWVMNSDVPV